MDDRKSEGVLLPERVAKRQKTEDDEESSPGSEQHEKSHDSSSDTGPPPEPEKIEWKNVEGEEIRRVFVSLSNYVTNFERSFEEPQNFGSADSPFRGMTRHEYAAEVLLHQIKDHIERYPDLPTIVDRGYSLLIILCETVSTQVAEPSIKYLVSKNPHSLLWESHWTDELVWEPGLGSISLRHPKILLWILQEYRWLLDGTHCHTYVNLVRHYLNGDIPASMVKEFYTEYPKRLANESFTCDDNKTTFPVRILLDRFASRGNHSREWTQSDQALLEWMVEVCPNSIGRGILGWTDENYEETSSALHHLCHLIASRADNGNIEAACKVARFLLSHDPEPASLWFSWDCHPSVRRQLERFPLVIIGPHCNNKHIQELGISMIRHYCDDSHNEEFDHDGQISRSLFSFPFYARIRNCVLKEKEIHDELVILKWVLKWACSDKVSSDQDYKSHAGKVFLEWADLRLKAKFSTIPRVQNIREVDIPRIKAEFEQGEQLSVDCWERD